MSKTIVKFTKRHGVYNPNDIAGFDADKAKWLVESAKVAKVHKGEPKAPTAEEIAAEEAAKKAAK